MIGNENIGTATSDPSLVIQILEAGDSTTQKRVLDCGRIPEFLNITVIDIFEWLDRLPGSPDDLLRNVKSGWRIDFTQDTSYVAGGHVFGSIQPEAVDSKRN